MRCFYKILIMILVILHVLSIVSKIDLSYGIFFIGLLIGFMGLKVMTQAFRQVSIFFLVLGIGGLYAYHQSVAVWMDAFNSMTNFISILVVMQLFVIPISAGKYDQILSYWLKKICGSSGELFIFTMLTTHILSSFLSMGTVPVVINLFKDVIKTQVQDYKRFISTAVSRSFTLGTLWAPGAATIFLVGQVTGVSWPKLFVPSLLIGIGGIFVSYLLERWNGHISSQEKGRLNLVNASDWEMEHRNRIWHILLAIASLILLTMLFIELGIAASSEGIILSGLLVASAWIFILGRDSGIEVFIKQYWQSDLLKAADMSPFFIAIGVFSGAFTHSGLENILEMSLQGYAENLGIAMLLLIPLCMIILSLIGLHPLISIVILGQMLMALHLSLPPLVLALCLNVGSSIAYMISPFAGVIVAIAALINAKTVEVAIRWNWRFCGIYFIIAIVFAYYLGSVFA